MRAFLSPPPVLYLRTTDTRCACRTVTPELHDTVRDIVPHPGSSLYGTSNDRWWVKQKGFTIGKDSNGVVRVHCKEKGNLAARPVALVDELFGIIEAAHVCDGQHLGRDRTFEAVQKNWAKVTKGTLTLIPVLSVGPS